MDLQKLARGYFESAGFKILAQENQCIIADRLIFGHDRDTFVVWTIPENTDPSRYESTLWGKISDYRPNYPEAKAYVLSSIRSGFSRDILQTFTDSRIKLLSPIQFFDAAFKVEEAPRAASSITDIRAQAEKQKRVPQPFRVAKQAASSNNTDLLTFLLDDIKNANEPTVRVIVGRAGIGKSYLFRSLFSHMYDAFLSAKKSLSTGSRPIPLIPEHLKETYAYRTEALVENFLRTDVASPVGRDTFEWLLENGFTNWLLDGLDELYAGDPDFFLYISDLITRNNSKAQITIFCRDSLLTTSDSFTEFNEICSGTNYLQIYHLSEWKRPSKRLFAWYKVEDKLPYKGDEDTPGVRSFLSEIESNETISALSALPFYCELLFRQHMEGHIKDFKDDVDFLNFIIDQMIEREVSKGLLDLRMFEEDGLKEWIEQIAINFVETDKYAGINCDEAMEYGKLVLMNDLDTETEDHILTSLLQFPLFQAGEETGSIVFTHELIAEALAARAYLRYINKDPARVSHGLLRIDLEDPIILRFMAKRLGHIEEATIIEELRKGTTTGRQFSILLTLLMIARPDRNLLKKYDIPLEAKELSGVTFYNRDFSNMSFRGSDISYATFENCDLSGAFFEGAFLNHTKFEGRNELKDTKFGDIGRIQSITVKNKHRDDPDELRNWIKENAGISEIEAEPCPSALQLLRLFGKFVTPLGKPKRNELNRSALCSGKKYSRAALPESCLDEAIKSGYISSPDFRDRCRRTEGDKYAELIKFVRDSRVSDGIGGMLSKLCTIKGCLHQLKP